MPTYTKKAMPDLMVNDASGAILADVTELSGVDAQTGEARTAGDNANHAYTAPATTQKAVVNAEGGDVRWKLGGAASATSGGRIPKDGTLVIRIDATANLLNLYIPSGSTANIVYLTRA